MEYVRETCAAFEAQHDFQKMLKRVRLGKSYCYNIQPTDDVDKIISDIRTTAASMTEAVYQGIEKKWDDAGLFVEFYALIQNGRTGELSRIHIADGYAPIAAMACFQPPIALSA